MSTATHLGRGDYDAALALVSEAAANVASQPFGRPTIESLLRAIPANRAGYFEYSNGGVTFGAPNTFVVDAPYHCDPLYWDSDTVRATLSSWPLRDCAGNQRPKAAPRKLSDSSRVRREPEIPSTTP